MCQPALTAHTTGYTCPDCRRPTGLRAVVNGKIKIVPCDDCSKDKKCSALGCRNLGHFRALLHNNVEDYFCGPCALEVERDKVRILNGEAITVLHQPNPENMEQLRQYAAGCKEQVIQMQKQPGGNTNRRLCPKWEETFTKQTLRNIQTGKETWEGIKKINDLRAKAPQQTTILTEKFIFPKTK